MKLRYIFTLAAVALLGLGSCSDFLDKETDTRVTLNNIDQLQMLLVDAYPNYNYALMGELSSDNMIDNNSPSATGIRYNLPSYGRNDDELFAWDDVRSESSWESPTEFWATSYHAIAVANAVLEKVAELETQGENSDKLKAVKGEALMCRAYNHFALANIFCMPYRGPELSKNDPGIPYIKAPETKVLVKYDRGTMAETYDNIEADIVEALPLVSDSYYEIPKYHFNKQAAYAFATRFYLFKRDYEKVLEYANTVFGGENVDPTPYMSDVWAQDNLNTFTLAARYFSNTTLQRNFMCMTMYSILVRHLYGGRRYAVNRESLRATMRGPGPNWENCRWVSSVTNETWAMLPCFKAIWTNGGQEYGCYYGGAVGEFFEYTDKIAGIGYPHNIRTEFTGEETLLCRAEAKIYLGDIDGAVADLKVWVDARARVPEPDDRMVELTKDNIRDFYTRALNGYVNNVDNKTELGEKYWERCYFGIAKPIAIDEVCPSDKYTATADIMPFLQCVQHFRRIENIHNGMRWFDIKRLGLSYSHYIGKSEVRTLQKLDPRYALQIPIEVLSAGLEANDRTPVSAPLSSAQNIATEYLSPYNGD